MCMYAAYEPAKFAARGNQKLGWGNTKIKKANTDAGATDAGADERKVIAAGFGAWLKGEREQRGLSQNQLGIRAKMKQHGYISGLESGISVPSLSMLRRIVIGLLPDDYTEEQFNRLLSAATVASGRLPSAMPGAEVNIRHDGTVRIAHQKPDTTIELEEGMEVELRTSGKPGARVTLTPGLLKLIQAYAKASEDGEDLG